MDLLNIKKEPIDFNEKLRILKEIALGVEFLHQKKIIHRDLKCENLLFSDDWTIKIIDFGISKKIKNDEKERFTSRIGTSFYIAPEITLGKEKYDFKVDVFSYSMIICILLLENTDLFDRNIVAIEYKMAKDPNLRPDISNFTITTTNEWLVDLMKRC